MKYLYILKVGETFPTTKQKHNDFDSWIIRFLKNKNTKIIDIQKGEKLPNIPSAKGFIITGSHSMVTDNFPWSLALEKYIKKISKTTIPLLGICYGHQLITKALGGKSDFNKNGKEIGTVKIKKVANEPLLQGIPKQFFAYETHYQTAVKLPKGAKVLAKNKRDQHQAVQYTKHIYGVQFHPEFDKAIMKEYVLNQKDALTNLGYDTEVLIQNIKKCDLSSRVFINFMNIIKSK